MGLRHWALGVSYNGARYHGWQRQQDTLKTVQGQLETALSKIADEPIRTTAAGRTDAGVHATAQVAGFASNSNRDKETWLRGLNGLTDDDLSINWVSEVDEKFHARYAASSRRYHYVFHDQGRFADPHMTQRVWHCGELDADAMHREAQALLGEHDFSSFRAAGCQSSTAQRQVNACSVRRSGEFVVMHIEANAFLLHMVRNIASALHDVGRGQATRTLHDLLALKDRTALGVTAPSDGLYLTGVGYTEYSFPEGRLPAFLNSP